MSTHIRVGKDNSNTRKNDPIKRKKKSYNIDEIDKELGNISNAAGVYILSPYANLDDHGRTVFKIGMSLNLKKRTDNYMVMFPSINFHSFITGFDDAEYKEFKKKNKDNKEIVVDDLNNEKIKRLKLFREINEIEKKLIDRIYERDQRSRKLYFRQREVASEWIYTKAKYIDEVALEICEEYELEHKGYDNNYNEYLKDEFQLDAPKAIFIGKIIFTNANNL